MFYPGATINWLDTSTGEWRIESLSNFIRFNSKYLRFDNNYVRLYDFSTTEVRVRDLEGWTRLLKVKISKENFEWRKITVGNESIVVSVDTLIPVYDDIENPTIGFHGERKYSYTFKNPDKILPSDFIRLTSPAELILKLFANFSSIEKGYINTDHSFDIVTTSRFINMDGMYMFAGDSITAEEAKKMAPDPIPS